MLLALDACLVLISDGSAIYIVSAILDSVEFTFAVRYISGIELASVQTPWILSGGFPAPAACGLYDVFLHRLEIESLVAIDVRHNLTHAYPLRSDGVDSRSVEFPFSLLDFKPFSMCSLSS